MFLKPVAFCLLLLVGAAPAAGLACQWMCTPPAGPAHRHTAHHEHSREAVHAADVAIDTTSVLSSASVCDHGTAISPGLTSATVNVFAPATTPAAALRSFAFLDAQVVPVSYTTGSPPGPRSAPLALRI